MLLQADCCMPGPACRRRARLVILPRLTCFNKAAASYVCAALSRDWSTSLSSFACSVPWLVHSSIGIGIRAA